MKFILYYEAKFIKRNGEVVDGYVQTDPDVDAKLIHFTIDPESFKTYVINTDCLEMSIYTPVWSE